MKEEEKEAEKMEKTRNDEATHPAPSINEMEISVTQVPSIPHAEVIKASSEIVVSHGETRCGSQCQCENGRCLLMRRMEKILKRFIVSLRNKDKEDFKKYYKTVMQNLDATFETQTFVELHL